MWFLGNFSNNKINRKCKQKKKLSSTTWVRRLPAVVPNVVVIKKILFSNFRTQNVHSLQLMNSFHQKYWFRFDSSVSQRFDNSSSILCCCFFSSFVSSSLLLFDSFAELRSRQWKKRVPPPKKNLSDKKTPQNPEISLEFWLCDVYSLFLLLFFFEIKSSRATCASSNSIIYKERRNASISNSFWKSVGSNRSQTKNINTKLQNNNQFVEKKTRKYFSKKKCKRRKLNCDKVK